MTAALPDAESLTAFEAFRVAVLDAAARVAAEAGAAWGGEEQAWAQFPFLADYAHAQIIEAPAAADDSPVARLESRLGLDAVETRLLFVVGLVEEDVRFGPVFEALNPVSGQSRPTQALLQAWWGNEVGDGVRHRLQCLRDLELLAPANPEAPRLELAFEVSEAAWAALRGEPGPRPFAGGRLTPARSLPRLDDLVLAPATRQRGDALLAALAATPETTLIVRGPRHNGRGALLRAVAGGLGHAALEIDWQPGTPFPAAAGAVAALRGAMPILRLDLPPGETAALPALPGYAGPLGVVCGETGSVEGPRSDRAVGLTLPKPDFSARRRLLAGALPDLDGAARDALATELCMGSGCLLRAAANARFYLPRDDAVPTARELRRAAAAAGAGELETLATRVDAGGGWPELVADAETLAELRALEARCRQRERLAGRVSPTAARRLGAGVRALFAGPSGTGKTLCAQILATELGMELYRVDLGAVVSKYIGETEKNLHRLFAAAESSDVMLLLDEGDALLARRTDVGNAVDRYANLETNFLLQRLEHYAGIVVVTSNTPERIDKAFERRLDAVVHFRPPQAAERHALWGQHLPVDHRVAPETLIEVSESCQLAGGQIRNVVLHAALLALGDGTPIGDRHLAAALQREYRRSGGLCPLPTRRR